MKPLTADEVKVKHKCILAESWSETKLRWIRTRKEERNVTEAKGLSVQLIWLGRLRLPMNVVEHICNEKKIKLFFNSASVWMAAQLAPPRSLRRYPECTWLVLSYQWRFQEKVFGQFFWGVWDIRESVGAWPTGQPHFLSCRFWLNRLIFFVELCPVKDLCLSSWVMLFNCGPDITFGWSKVGWIHERASHMKYAPSRESANQHCQASQLFAMCGFGKMPLETSLSVLIPSST